MKPTADVTYEPVDHYRHTPPRHEQRHPRRWEYRGGVWLHSPFYYAPPPRPRYYAPEPRPRPYGWGIGIRIGG